MKKHKLGGVALFFVRTLILALALVGALALAAGVLMLTKNPLAYVWVGAMCALLLVGLIFGLLLSREGNFFFDMLSPFVLSVLLVGVGLILSGGQVSPYVLLNCALFLAAFTLTRLLPRKRKHRRGF